MRTLLLIANTAWVVSAASPAWAYLDPGSGSYALQVLIGLAAGLLFTVRSTLGRWAAWVRGLFRKPPRKRR
jgi:hypothetical protein